MELHVGSSLNIGAEPFLPLRRKAATVIRSVWAANLEEEFELIRSTIITHPYATIDTEFPGVIHYHPTKPFYALSSVERYDLLKSNANDLKLIQFGLTLTDAKGELPDFGIWEFNFNDFDPEYDSYNHTSIALLKAHGIDFERNQKEGIDSRDFSEHFLCSGLVYNGSPIISWVGFSSAYDFGYLIKVLTGKPLPESMDEFLSVLGGYFGDRIFDMKHLAAKLCRKDGKGMKGGLDAMAENLNVRRVAGRCHQAGSDSLLTCHAFHEMTSKFMITDRMEEQRDSTSRCSRDTKGLEC